MTKRNNRDAMLAQAAQGSARAPTLGDRLRHAHSMATQHPTESLVQTTQKAAGSTGSFREIPLDQIDDNPWNARVSYRLERVTELAASIAANGQETPGTATIRNGRYVLAAGHYRKRALVHIDAPTMLLRIVENMSDQDLYEVSFRENHERESHSCLDNAMLWSRLIVEGIYQDEAAIADRLKLSRGFVTKTMSVLKLSNEVQEVLRQGSEHVGITTLYELYLFEKVAGPHHATNFAKQVLAGEIGRNIIEAARKEFESSKPRKTHETSRQYKICGADDAKIGVIKEWDNGRVTFDVKFTDPEDRIGLINLLKERYAIPKAEI